MCLLNGAVPVGAGEPSLLSGLCLLTQTPLVQVFSATEGIVQRRSAVHMTRGRKVLEIRPRVNWDKGKALLHLLRALGLADAQDVMPLYIGDDRTDEDAFRVLHGSGVGVLVSSIAKTTAANFTLTCPDQVCPPPPPTLTRSVGRFDSGSVSGL